MHSSEAGVSLVEVSVALVVAGVALTGAFRLVASATRSLEAGRDQTTTAVLASARAEALRALTFGWDEGGQRLTDLTTDLTGPFPSGAGSGLTPSPPDSLERDTPGFVDYLARDGRWLGAGPGMPAGTWFVRRWRIAPLASDPADSLLIQVLVTTRLRALLGAVPARRQLPGDSRLVVVLTRKVH